MGILGPSKKVKADLEYSFWAGGDGKTGKHHGGNLHGDPSDTPRGKHAKPITNVRKVKNSGKAPKGGKK